MGFKDKPFMKMNKVVYYNELAKKYADADTVDFYEQLRSNLPDLEFTIVPFTDGVFVKTVVCTLVTECNNIGLKPYEVNDLVSNVLGNSCISIFLDYYILTDDVAGLDIMDEEINS